MKRYIKATFSSSAPKWFKERSKPMSYRTNNMDWKNDKKSRIKWDTIQFYDDNPDGTYTPVYFLDSDPDGVVYIPGINDDAYIRINDRVVRVDSLSKKKFNDLIIDTKYIDLNSPDSYSDREKYIDPRYYYSFDRRDRNHGRYDGQTNWLNGWYSGHGRDKSGYKIPSPETLRTRYYMHYPKKALQEIDTVYQRILKLRDEIFELKVRDDYVESIGTELVDHNNDPRELNYFHISTLLGEFDVILTDYKNMLGKAAMHSKSVDRFERWNYDDDEQRSYDLEDIGKNGKELSRTIKDIMKKIDETEYHVSKVKSIN